MKRSLPILESCTIAVIGLGYVGLPVAIEFARKTHSSRSKKPLCRKIIGFDINEERLSELKNGFDRTNEINENEIKRLENITFSSVSDDITLADVYIVTVPTPIDKAKRPNLRPVVEASKTIANAIKKRNVLNLKTAPLVIYESTVYPGATEEECIPILEKISGLKLNQDFYCGYSPERINPGDSEHNITSIIKVTSGSDEESGDWIDNLYGSIIDAGTHMAANIKVAEAAKVIENTQRDLNIALINELSLIFSELNIDTLDVLEAASTKWNFLQFKPGLVGGHCIGVDPYYLTHKAEEIGYHPQVVLAGRRINDSMGSHHAKRLVEAMAGLNLPIVGSKILVLGLTFKENCPDLRNTRVINLIQDLSKYGIIVNVVDPWASSKEARKEFNIQVNKDIPNDESYAGAVLAVAHNEFKNLNYLEWESLTYSGLILDLKGIVPRNTNTLRP